MIKKPKKNKPKKQFNNKTQSKKEAASSQLFDSGRDDEERKDVYNVFIASNVFLSLSTTKTRLGAARVKRITKIVPYL